MAAIIRAGQIHVTCDDCGTELVVTAVKLHKYSYSWVTAAEIRGWTIHGWGGQNGDACPDCWDDTPAEQWQVTTPPAVYASDEDRP